MDLNLKGKIAWVCGSTQGIGKASASELAALGADLVLVARNEEKLKAVASEIEKKFGRKVSFLAADFSRPAELKSALVNSDLLQKGAHILVNNTGGPPGGPANLADPEAYRLAFNQHLICNQILVQALLPYMKDAGYGRIINVISTSVKQPLKDLGVSNTIRGAVANWAKTLATELGGFGITVNNVLPGATETERLSSIIENKSQKTQKESSEIAAQMKSIIPAGRFGLPEEIGVAVAFLASPAASYINGINLPVDGGRTTCL